MKTTFPRLAIRSAQAIVSIAALVPALALAVGFDLLNGEFDEDLSSWENFYDRPAAWDSLDAQGSASSGSALITNDMDPSNGATPIVLTQCIRADANATYVVGGEMRVESSEPADTSARIFLYSFSERDCTGEQKLVGSLQSTSSGTWELWNTTTTTGPTVQSLLVSLGVRKPNGVSESASARFDRVFVFSQGLVEGFVVDPSMSTVWFNPDEPGHGVMLHLISATQAWVCWFNFDLDGNRSWVCGLGGISGDTLNFPNVFIVEGGKFPPLFDPDLIEEVPWGAITITFVGCDEGLMEWTTTEEGYQSGTMPLVRSVDLWNNSCTQD